jgi:putative endonuclease
MPYSVYIVRCSDGTYYTGIAIDVDKRLHEHNHSPKGARYTRSRRPVTLVYSEEQSDRSRAQKREYAIKRMTRKEKEFLIKSDI